ncbi:MAG: hypothetical protein JW974_00635 [Alphaproteobacteria bacterium]|nr:hypothetical protein [Alphaproteobacteria bacterium]MBN2675255.1 hypothetical protein [Alphaproteobacteria bacterium]
MKETIKKLNSSDISSEVFIISPTQIEYIAQIFGDSVADAMNMRTFAQKIRKIAEQSLLKALNTAKKQGLKK